MSGSECSGKRQDTRGSRLRQEKILKTRHQATASFVRWSAYGVDQYLVDLRSELLNPR